MGTAKLIAKGCPAQWRPNSHGSRAGGIKCGNDGGRLRRQPPPPPRCGLEPWQLCGNGRNDWSTKLIRGLVTEAATGFQSRRGRCREPTPVIPHYALFPTYKAGGGDRGACGAACRRSPVGRRQSFAASACCASALLRQPSLKHFGRDFAISAMSRARISSLNPGSGGSVEELPHLAADLVRRNVEVLVASGTPSVVAARDVSKTVPVVFVAAFDPVSTGVVDSLARPGGNVTGLTAIFADLNGKRLELLKELVPSLSRVAFVSHLTNPGHQQNVQELERAAKKLSVQLQIIAIRSRNDFEETFRRAAGAEGLIQIDDAMLTAHREQLTSLALRHRLPGVYGARLFADLGGLASLGASYPDLHFRAAHYIDLIFKGAKPSDLPVQQPTKFEFIINLKTARALGLTIPPTLLARADEVIE